ncbi:hypothetical protein [Rhodococcus triatomae]|nr:hypothetical protein G419_16188 [Rhodococcus triatomae BKS 15-14]
MGRPTRRSSKREALTPEALSGLLPDELKSLQGVGTPGDYQAMRSHVVDWLNQATAGQGQDLAPVVMDAAGLSAAEFYRQALAAPTAVDRWEPPAPPVVDEYVPPQPTQEQRDRHAALMAQAQTPRKTWVL